jgi:hypothetical protein
MLDAFALWWSFRKNANFWDWIKDTYNDDQLRQLSKEATDCNLAESYDPLGEQMADQFMREKHIRRKFVKRLLRRYGYEIWDCCLGAGGLESVQDNPLHCLSKLDLASQAYNQATFEEFLVRNALKHASRRILEARNEGDGQG